MAMLLMSVTICESSVVKMSHEIILQQVESQRQIFTILTAAPSKRSGTADNLEEMTSSNCSKREA
jgi:hypothetical protein